MGELASIMRKGRHFLITNNLIPSIDCKLHKRIPDLNENPFVLDTRSANPMRVFRMYIAGEMWQNLIFLVEKNA